MAAPAPAPGPPPESPAANATRTTIFAAAGTAQTTTTAMAESFASECFYGLHCRISREPVSIDDALSGTILTATKEGVPQL